jgi:ABC-type sugar transport system ATPase subunit
MSPDPILEVRDIRKRYGYVEALRGVDFALKAGEIVGLVGDNGAGKSTLVKVISGAIAPDEGEILLDGKHFKFDDPLHARRAGIETMYQDLSLIPTLSIAENAYLGREEYRGGGFGRRIRWMAKKRMRRNVERGFEELGLTLPPPSTQVTALSGGQRQAVAIARAVLWGSHVVMLDEPTAALGVRQTEIVLSFIERLREQRVGVVFISHDVPQLLRVADRLVVLRLGSKVYDGPTRDVDATSLVAMMTGAMPPTAAA